MLRLFDADTDSLEDIIYPIKYYVDWDNKDTENHLIKLKTNIVELMIEDISYSSFSERILHLIANLPNLRVVDACFLLDWEGSDFQYLDFIFELLCIKKLERIKILLSDNILDNLSNSPQYFEKFKSKIAQSNLKCISIVEDNLSFFLQTHPDTGCRLLSSFLSSIIHNRAIEAFMWDYRFFRPADYEYFKFDPIYFELAQMIKKRRFVYFCPYNEDIIGGIFQKMKLLQTLPKYSNLPNNLEELNLSFSNFALDCNQFAMLLHIMNNTKKLKMIRLFANIRPTVFYTNIIEKFNRKITKFETMLSSVFIGKIPVEKVWAESIMNLITNHNYIERIEFVFCRHFFTEFKYICFVKALVKRIRRYQFMEKTLRALNIFEERNITELIIAFATIPPCSITLDMFHEMYTIGCNERETLELQIPNFKEMRSFAKKHDVSFNFVGIDII